MTRAAIAFMAVLVSGDVGGRVAWSASAEAQVDLIGRLTAADIAKLSVRGASVHRDPVSKALTFTLNYPEGHPEVRIPVRQLGWPTDWRAWRSVQYTFVTSDRDLIVTGNVTFDLLGPGRRLTPFVVAGGGLFRHSDRFARGSFSSTEGAFTAGGGARGLVNDRVLVRGDFRIGWELH